MFPGAILCFSLIICSASLTPPSNQLISSDATEVVGSSWSTNPFTDSTIRDITPSSSSEISGLYVTESVSTTVPAVNAGIVLQSTSATNPFTDSTLRDIMPSSSSEISGLYVTESVSTTVPAVNADNTEAGIVLQSTSDNFDVSVSETLSTRVPTEAELTTTAPECPKVLKSVNPKTKNATVNSVTVTWKDEADESHCFHYYQLNVFTHEIRNISQNETNFTVEGLEACKKYNFNLFKVSQNDQQLTNEGNYSFDTEIAVPGKVGNLNVKANSSQIIVHWTEPSENGACAHNYRIDWKHGNITGNNTTENKSYAINNLDACVEYEIAVSASNIKGERSLPETRNITTDTALPGKVINLTVIVNSREIIVNWEKPSENGECVRSYTIHWNGTEHEEDTVNSSVVSYIIKHIEPCVEYSISVRANGENESSEVEVTNATAPEGPPGKVQNLTLKAELGKIELNWTKPIENSNCMHAYIIEWKDTTNESYPVNNTTTEELFYVIADLDACVNYEVSVKAKNSNGTSDAVIESETTLTDVPGGVENLTLEAGSNNVSLKWKKPSKNRDCVEYYVISWKHSISGNNIKNTTKTEEFLISGTDACVEYKVSVGALNERNQSEDVVNTIKTEAAATVAPIYEKQLCWETEKACLKWKLPQLSSNKCKLENCTVVCYAVDSPGLPVITVTSQEFKNDSFIVNVIGLSPSTTYNCVAYITNEWGQSKNSSNIYFTTEQGVPVGAIVGVLFAIIIVGLLAVIFVTYRKGNLVWPPKLFVKAKQATVRPQPVLLKKFPAYCIQMLDTPARLGSEYQLLATLSADISEANSCVNGQMPENRRKNRYINILPYDDTRVTLEFIDGDPTSHYINASFIKGYTNDIEYIATQGPKEETCLDFWRMVFQHDVRVIVMVTNLVEQDKVKCHQYYPNLRENVTFGDMTIRCTTEIKFPIHTARTLVLVKGERKRTLSHLHFREWPDFGVPQSTDVMIQFCQTMRHHAFAAELGLILVHCSAGVGRTGTLIAVDFLLQHICENKKVDIFGTVFKLRKQRTNMVQTEGQYTYIYRCIKDAIEDPTIVNHSTVTNNSLEPIYENVGTSLNTLHYEKLPKWKNKDDEA